MPSRLLLIIFFTLFLAYHSAGKNLYSSSYSEDPISYRAEENLRGNCQRELSGVYISLLDQIKLPLDEVKVLKNHRSYLEAKKNLLKDQMAKPSPQNAYDAKEDLHTDLQQSASTAIELELKNLEILEGEKKSAEAKAQKRIRTFESLLSPTLLIKEKKTKTGSPAYNKSVVFQYNCPKHNESCLLIEGELKTFEKLDDSGFLTPTCRKFLLQSKAQFQ